MGKERAEEIPRRRIRATKLDPTKEDIAEAYQEARSLVPLHLDPENSGNQQQHPVLPGVTKKSGDRINAIVALRIDGFRDKDISELLDIPQPEPHRLERTHPNAFAKAEAHVLVGIERKYKINMHGVRAALSEYAPRMVKVLADLAENPKIKENVRRSAATDILNLLGVGSSRQSVGGKDSNIKGGTANVFIQTVEAQEQEREQITVEAEDAEIIEEQA